MEAASRWGAKEMTKVRKSRLRRSGMAPVLPIEEWFEPSESDWNRIELAYGIKFKPEQRAEIEEIVNSFIVDVNIVNNSSFIKDSIYWLTHVRKSLDSLYKATRNKKGKNNKNISVAIDDATITFISKIRSRRQEICWRVGTLDSLIMDLRLAVAKSVLEYIKFEQRGGGFVEGSAWDLLIQRLTQFAEKNDFPRGARKDSDKTKTEKASPFVCFVRELQATVPLAYRPGYNGDANLAGDISKARRKPAGT